MSRAVETCLLYYLLNVESKPGWMVMETLKSRDQRSALVLSYECSGCFQNAGSCSYAWLLGCARLTTCLCRQAFPQQDAGFAEMLVSSTSS